MINFEASDEWAVRVLKVHGDLYLTDWSAVHDLGPDYFPVSPEIEVRKLAPEGGSFRVGVLGEEGIFDVALLPMADGGFYVDVIEVAAWQDIEVLPV